MNTKGKPLPKPAMTLAVNSLRIYFRMRTRAPFLCASPAISSRVSSPAVATTSSRTISSTPARRIVSHERDPTPEEEAQPDPNSDVKSAENPEAFFRDFIHSDKTTESQKETAREYLNRWREADPEVRNGVMRAVRHGISAFEGMDRNVRPKRDSFWNSEEDDPEMVTDEIGEDDFEEDDMLSMAHSKLEEHRERREYARLTIYDMPLLSKLAKPFEPPDADQPLRFRYTTYMGEFHPSEKKVVVEFCPKDLPLTDSQQLKLRKLAGVRWNPEKDIVKMSCEIYEHPAQNKRYLGDTVDRLIEAAKDPTDMFEDIPLDTRHHKTVVKPKFPKSWYMSDKNWARLVAWRAEAYKRDKQKELAGTVVDGTQVITNALAAREKGFLGSRFTARVGGGGGGKGLLTMKLPGGGSDGQRMRK